MRILAALVFAVLAAGQSQPSSAPQQPSYQPGWPCTGKERSFDPVYAKVAEASGGQVFLFDKSEVGGFSAVAIGDMKHKQTVERAAGKLESYIDIPFPVDSSIDSLFITVTLQCMQTVQIYDPLRVVVNADQSGGQDNWYRAGRISTIPKPAPGQWILRLAGTGPYFVAVQAHTMAGGPSFEYKGEAASAHIDPAITDPRFSLVDAGGEALEPLTLTPDPDGRGRYEGRVDPPAQSFRFQVEWTNSMGELVRRIDPRLFDPKTPVTIPAPARPVQ